MHQKPETRNPSAAPVERALSSTVVSYRDIGIRNFRRKMKETSIILTFPPCLQDERKRMFTLSKVKV
jgi:hypothetical protein